MASNAILKALGDEVYKGSKELIIRDAFDPNDVELVLETTDYPGMGFPPETERMRIFSGPRCRAFDILCGKVNAK